jgi:phosphoribosylformylglycinamidine synthase I
MSFLWFQHELRVRCLTDGQRWLSSQSVVRVCILFAAGTNCDQESAYAFELVGAVPEVVHVNRFRTGERKLEDFQILLIPGGFSYGDYIASGRIFANELKHFLRDQIEQFIACGKLVLGICNGFQVLVKCGLLPAFERPFEPQTVTLDTNDSGRYEDRWVYLKIEDSPGIFTRNIESPMYLPVAHTEGKFLAKSVDVLGRLNDNRQVSLRYTTLDGEPATFPDNPNGSEEDIAGICDPTGRIFGLMPHPERFVRREQHPRWHRERVKDPDGNAIFRNAVEYARKNL